MSNENETSLDDIVNMTNVVCLTAKRAEKKEEAEQVKLPLEPLVANVTDRETIILHHDNTIEVLLASEVYEKRLATRIEVTLMNRQFYLGAMVVELLKKHEPHRVLDDYVVVPYIDWPTIEASMNKTFGHEESTLTLRMRALHPVIEDVRTAASAIDPNIKIGWVENASVEARYLGSDISPLMICFDAADCVKDLSLNVVMRDRYPVQHHSIDCSLVYPAFESKEQRARFIAQILSTPSIGSTMQLIDLWNLQLSRS